MNSDADASVKDKLVREFQFPHEQKIFQQAF
jgi:hypothetical protein